MPSSQLGRIWQYGGLAASMALGAAGEGFWRATGSSIGGHGSLMLNAGNIERLVAKLSKMRGAALKLGQMMSFQGQNMPFFTTAGELTIRRFEDASTTSSRAPSACPRQC